MIDELDTSLADAGDLALSAAREHLARGAPMRIGPAYRHPGTFAAIAALVLAPTLAVVAVSLVGHELGFTVIAAAADPLIARIDTVRPLDLFLVLAPLIAFVLAILPLLDLRIERGGGAPEVAVRIRAITANLAIGTAALLVGAALIAHIVSESVLQIGA